MNLSINSPTTILIVDDSESDRVTYRRFLERDENANYQILEAVSLEEGLAIWRSNQPNLALIDINLPDGRGLAFLEAIQPDDPNLKLPIIVITGQRDERMAVQAMKLRASDYLIKEDITGAFLRYCVTQVINQCNLSQKLARFQQQESLLAKIALNTRKFLDQKDVYQAIVTEVREFLAADRMIIYQFNPDMSGQIVAESVIAPWPSCLHAQVVDSCFQENRGGDYQTGKLFVVDDIYAANLTDCHVQLLEQFQIRASLVVPILLPTEQEQDHLWGLLVFHQCSGPRHWDETDLGLINRLSVQLAVAIQQADWYWKLQTLNQSLEQKVAERTIDLQALLTQNQQTQRDRQQAETEVKNLQERLSRVLKGSNDGWWDWNIVTDELYLSPSWWNMIGYEEGELESTLAVWQSLIHPDDRHFVREHLDKTLANPTLEFDEIEFRMRHKQGHYVPILSRGMIERDANYRPLRSSGTNIDLTLLKQKEQELQTAVDNLHLLNNQLEDRVRQRTKALEHSQYLVERILNTSPNLIYLEDIQAGKLLFINQIVSSLLGYSPEELLGMGTSFLTELIHPDDLNRVLELGQRERMGEIGEDEIIEIEYRIRDKQGNWRWFVSKETVFSRDEQGNVKEIIGNAQDISLAKQREAERQRTEEALRLSEQRFRRAFDNTAVGMSLVSMEGKFLQVNTAICDFLGYEESELLNLTFQELTYPEDLDRDTAFFQQLIAGEVQHYLLEKRYLNKQGETIWGLLSISVIRDSQNHPIYCVCQVQNINDRKKSEIALQESEAKFRLLAENIPGVIYRYVLHPDGRDQFIYVNPYVETIYGVTPEAAIEDPMALFAKVHADDIQALRNTVAHSAQNLNPFYSEHRITATDGTLKWLQVTSIPKRQTNGDILWQGIILDISDRKKAERALRESQQFIQTIIDTVPLPLFWKNRESVFLGCNYQLASILGLNSSDDIIGKTDFDLSPTIEQAKLYRTSDQRVMNSGIAEQGVEETQILDNGAVIWIEAHKAPLRDGDNQVIGIVGIFQDITERKHYELQLQQKNQELEALLQLREEALRLREDMSNMIVHDLRNPLATMILAASIIRKSIDRAGQQAQILRKAEQILESGKQLQSMIDSLLFMAKLESGTLLFNPTETDLHQLGSAVLADFDLVASSSQISLLSELPPPGKNILVDATILRRIIDNLMSNAFKFSPIGGSVHLSLEYLPCNRVKVKVSDTGLGISEDEKQKIFNKFEIGNLKPGVPQTGLGLAFCKMAVEAHQGTLAIEPNHPQGSIFIVEI